MKLIDTGEIKMVNAVMYFANRVKYPYKLKIYKLLYFLDFIHFAQVGRPVTNQEYCAFEKGPVPKELDTAINEEKLSDYFKRNIKIISESFPKGKAYKFISLAKPKMEVFSPRELETLNNVITIFKDAKAEEMTESSHLKNHPWERTKTDKGLFSTIDYLLAIDENALISREIAAERLESHKEMINLFGNE